MPEEIRFWRISEGDNLIEIPKSKLNREERIENWIERDISIVSKDLIVIGRQVTTDFGGCIDLICLDRRGDVVIIELKKDKTPREVVAQVLDYASWVRDLTPDRIVEIANDYLGEKEPLNVAFDRKFGVEVPSNLNETHKMLIVASEIDESTERILRYLNEDYGVNINAVTFNFFSDDKNEYIARSFIIDPKSVEYTSGTKKRRKINKDEFLKACSDKERKLFERILQLEDEFDLRTRWGSTGFTLNVKKADKYIPICFCYSPLASFGPLLQTSFKHISDKIGSKIDTEKYYIEMEKSGFFCTFWRI